MNHKQHAANLNLKYLGISLKQHFKLYKQPIGTYEPRGNKFDYDCIYDTRNGNILQYK